MSATADGRQPADEYRARHHRFDDERAVLDRRSLLLSRVRLALATCTAGAAIWTGYGGGAPPAAILVASIVVLGAVVVRHARVDERARRAATLAEINADALARVDRDWGAVRDWLPAVAPDAVHPFAADLDVAGHASLLRLLGRARSRLGDRRLTHWLLAPASAQDIGVRQQVAGSLAPQLDARQQLAAHALATHGMSDIEVDRFLRWCEDEPWLHRRPGLQVVFVALGLMGPALIVANALGWMDGWWVSVVAAGLLLSLAVQRPLARAFEDASWQAALRGWRAMFDVAATLRASAPRLSELEPRGVLDAHAGQALDALDRILGCASLRQTPVLHWPVHMITMWDAHVWWALERWQARHGAHVRGWLEAVATVEAVGALAGLAHDHPAWVFPQVTGEADALEAVGMGHPLIAPRKCVANDVRVGPVGSTVLVTGSNMSGKSTLLRAIGANAVLAQAGAPVCAVSLRMPPVRIVTSMRLADSLEDGVSFFMASLARLKLVVDAANDATARAGAPRVLYLLDELLSGTNTAERAVAVRAVLSHLVRCHALGALTTHDLALADAPDVRAHAMLVHFRESVLREDGRVRMTFDYRLRPGVATSTNALALMQVVGLSAALEGGDAARATRPTL